MKWSFLTVCTIFLLLNFFLEKISKSRRFVLDLMRDNNSLSYVISVWSPVSTRKKHSKTRIVTLGLRTSTELWLLLSKYIVFSLVPKAWHTFFKFLLPLSYFRSSCQIWAKDGIFSWCFYEPIKGTYFSNLSQNATNVYIYTRGFVYIYNEGSKKLSHSMNWLKSKELLPPK